MSPGRALRILYVDHPQANREPVREALTRPRGLFEIIEALTGEHLRSVLQTGEIDVILTALGMLEVGGENLLDLARAVDPFLPVVVLAEQATRELETAIDILRRGAADYVFRTPHHLERLPQVLHKVWQRAEARRHQNALMEKLQESEDFLRDLIEHTHEIIATHDLEGRILTINHAAEEMTGYRVEELIGRNLRDFIPSRYHADFDRYLETIRTQGRASGLMTIVAKNGEERIWEYRNTLRTTGVPKPIVRGYARDITEQYRAERALRESEARFRTLAERTSVAIFVYSGEHFVYVNPAMERITGYSADELLKMPFWQVVHPDQRELVRQRGLARQQGRPVPVRYEIKILRKDGSIGWVDFTAGRITWKGQPAAIGSAVDITERKLAEERLRASEARYRALVENSPYGIAIHQDGKLVFINPAGARLLGAEHPDEVLGEPVLRFVHPDYREVVKQRIREAIQDRKPGPLLEEKFIRLDGRAIDVEVVATPIMHEGRPAVQVIFHDITERKRAEEELRHLKEFHENLVTNVTEGILVLDPEGKITFVNPAMARMLGYTPQEMLGRLWLDFVVPEERRRARAKDRMRDKARVYRDELTLHRKDGTPLAAMVSVAPYRDPETGALLGTLGVVTDISGQKRHMRQLEAQTRIAEALGETTDMDALLEEILRAALYAVPAAEKGSILLMEPDGRLRIRALVGYTDPRLRGFAFPRGVGFAAQAAQRKQPLLIEDVNTDPAFRLDVDIGDLDEVRDIRSAVAAPLLLGEQVIGVISLDSTAPGAFQPEDLLTLSGIAPTAALVIERARLFEEVRYRAAYLATLNAILVAASSMLEDIPQILSFALDRMLEALGRSRGAIWLRATSKDGRYVALRGLPDTILGPATVFLKRPGMNLTSTLIVSDCLSPQAPEGIDFLQQFGVRAVLLAPLMSEGNRIGGLVVASEEPHEWARHEVDFVEAVGRQLGLLIERADLFQDLRKAHRELIKAYDETIEGWAKMLEMRDAETEGHTRRVTDLTLRLARAMGVKEEDLVHIRRGALLHDIGKMAIPDAILLKPGPLTREEEAIMRQHPEMAYQALSHIEYLKPALDIPRYHHERWDGSGYPFGLKGKEIPLAARIFAVVDVYDALTSDRPYRPAWPKEKALAYLQEQAGRLFDPEVVEAFLRMMRDEGPSVPTGDARLSSNGDERGRTQGEDGTGIQVNPERRGCSP